jgi:hypothetical protein
MRRLPARTVVLIALVATGCGAPVTSASSPAGSSLPSESTSLPASAGGTADMTAGPLAAGVTYLFPGFDGLALTPAEDGWTAGLPNGGDAQISSTSASVYFMVPATIVSSDGTARRDWPTDPAMATAQLEAVRGITIDRREPVRVAGVDTEILHITAGGLSAEAPMIQSGSGEWGFNDGPNDVILLPVGDRLLFITWEASGTHGGEALTMVDWLSIVD